MAKRTLMVQGNALVDLPGPVGQSCDRKASLAFLSELGRRCEAAGALLRAKRGRDVGYEEACAVDRIFREGAA